MFELLDCRIKKLINIFVNTYDLNSLNIVNDNEKIPFYIKELKEDNIFKENYNTLKESVETLKYLFKFTIHNNIDFKCVVLCRYNINNNETQEIIKTIFLIINILSSLYYDNIKHLKLKETEIIFYLYDKPRTLYNEDLNDKTFKSLYKANRFNCANGYTMTNKKKIVITRINKFNGLLVHELLHFYNLDQMSEDMENEWYNFFTGLNKITTPGLFFEGINNYKACIINLFIQRYIKDDLKDIEFKKLFEIEYLYSLLLCLKIMKFFNCSTFEEFVKSFNHEGSVFEYVFIKFLLLSNNQLFNNDLYLTFKGDIKEVEDKLKVFQLPINKHDKLNDLFKGDQFIDYYFF